MLITPLGEIEISIDNNPIKYVYKEIKYDKTCKDLSGRYSIVVNFIPDGKEHIIACRIKSYTPSEKDGCETGENLELKSFYKENVKLSLGMEGDTWYIDGKRLSRYDYDNHYIIDGVQYCLLSFTKTERYLFGIAWIENVNENNDVQTWFGADPTLF